MNEAELKRKLKGFFIYVCMFPVLFYMGWIMIGPFIYMIAGDMVMFLISTGLGIVTAGFIANFGQDVGKWLDNWERN